MSKIIYLNEYKRKHGIAMPRSPYSTLNATHSDIHEAYRKAAEQMRQAADTLGQSPYAVLVGYQDIKTRRVKLLKQMPMFSDKDSFERMAGIKGNYCLGLTRKAE